MTQKKTKQKKDAAYDVLSPPELDETISGVMICPLSMRSHYVKKCYGKFCPLWIKYSDNSMECAYKLSLITPWHAYSMDRSDMLKFQEKHMNKKSHDPNVG